MQCWIIFQSKRKLGVVSFLLSQIETSLVNFCFCLDFAIKETIKKVTKRDTQVNYENCILDKGYNYFTLA